jgi:hypothetical protein
VNNPQIIGQGKFAGYPGTFWAWKIDGYWDIHHADKGAVPDGSDVVSEFHPTLADARKWVREVRNLDRFMGAWTGEGL